MNFSCQQIKVNLIWLTWSLIKFNAELLLSIKSMRNCEKKTACTPQKLATTNFNDSMVFQYWIYMQAYFCLVACYSVLCLKFSSGFFFHLDKAYLNFYSFCCILVCGTPISISLKSFSSWYLGLTNQFPVCPKNVLLKRFLFKKGQTFYNIYGANTVYACIVSLNIS